MPVDPGGFELQGSSDASSYEGDVRVTVNLTFYRCTTCSATVTLITRRGRGGTDSRALERHLMWHQAGQPSDLP